MKNRLTDLNNHLFAQLERLSDEDLTLEQIEQEVTRTDAIVAVSDQIISNAEIVLKGAKLLADQGEHFKKHLPMLAEPKTNGEKT